MNILVLAKKYPFPVKDGESLAIHFLAKGYADAGCRVSILAMNTARHPADFAAFEAKRADFAHFSNVWTAAVDNSIRPFSALKNLFSKKSYHVQRHSSAAFETKLIEILKAEKWDAVQLETAFLAAYSSAIRQNSKAKIILRAHNVEHEIWSRIADGSAFLPKKFYLKNQSKRLAAFEKWAVAEADLLVPITERDSVFFREKMGWRGPSVVAPIGLDLEKYEPNWAIFEEKRGETRHLSFIGSLDWAPNAEGLRWFLDEAFEKMPAEKRHFFSLKIAGRRPPSWLLNRKMAGLEVVGEVDSATDFLNESPIMIAPILSGSGIRAKILEALALGRVVISTRMGLEGIDLTEKDQAVFFADSPAEWCAVFEEIEKMPLAELRKRGERGRLFVERNFGHLAVARVVLDELERMKIDLTR